MVTRADDPGTPCSRQPPELCDGARVVVLQDGISRREPALTPRTFCEPCRSRILACLDELPSAYSRLAAALGDTPKGGGTGVHVPFGPSIPLRAEIDALMRVIAVILPGWEVRVETVARLTLRNPERNPNTAESVKAAAEVIARQVDVLLALQPGWTTRTYTFPFEKPGKTFAQGALKKAPFPAETEAEIGRAEIVRTGDGWVTVMERAGGAQAGNEIIDLHYRARRRLGETKPPSESFDGIPCRACDEMALERAEPPSDPALPANHSRCASCRDEMSRDEFAKWADMYASWARGAAIQVCRRCHLAERADTEEKRAALHRECCWHACSCEYGEHPRRRAAA